MQAITLPPGSSKLIDRIQKESRPVETPHNAISGLEATSLFEGHGHDLCVWPTYSDNLGGQLALVNRKRMAKQYDIKTLVGVECL